MKARPTNSKLGGMVVLATFLTIFFSWGVASAADFHQPGMDCTDCHDVSGASANISAIRDSMVFRGGDPYPVTFLEPILDYARADDAGVCEGCHWDTKATHIDDMELELVYDDSDDCTTCHGTHCADTPNPGDPGMFSTGGGMPDDAPHNFHTAASAKHGGPIDDCEVCHVNGVYDDALVVAAEGGCDACHSPGGAFDGVFNATVGAAANWDKDQPESLVYEADGVTLKSGKEAWCAGCHDNDPAYSEAVVVEPPAPYIVDNLDPGFSYDPVDPDPPWGCKTKSDAYPSGGTGTFCYQLPGGDGSNKAIWRPNIAVEDAGDYKVYAWWKAGINQATNARYTVYYGDDPEVSIEFTVNQRIAGGQWNELTSVPLSFPNPEGNDYRVVLGNDADAGGRVVADAIKFQEEVGAGITAPKVVGDDLDDDQVLDYGFYLGGHGTGGVECLDCHDASKTHIDGEHRTYDSSSDPNNYQDGYRLKSINGGTPMVVPKPSWMNVYKKVWAFALCFDCHSSSAVLGTDIADTTQTNFWSTAGPVPDTNFHTYHLNMPAKYVDSDWNDSIESRITCITCHNVHGSRTPAMIRSGELISTYGTSDKFPALNFRYTPRGADLATGNGGKMAMNGNFGVNRVCTGCHAFATHYRTPYLGPKVISARATPDTVFDDGNGTALITASVSDSDFSGDIEVDLTPIDAGLGTETMYDDGPGGGHGDEFLDDGIYSCEVTVPEGASTGVKTLVITATDDALNEGTGRATLSVMGAPVPGVYTVDNSDPEPGFSYDPVDPDPPWGCKTKSDAYPSGGTGTFCYQLPGGDGSNKAIWRPNIAVEDAGDYKVYAWWKAGSNQATNARYTVYYGDDPEVSIEFTVNQRIAGSQWNELTSVPLSFPNPEGNDYRVVLGNDADAGGRVCADAIRFEQQ